MSLFSNIYFELTLDKLNDLISKHGKDIIINYKQNSCSLLSYAIVYDRPQVLKKLIECGADFNSQIGTDRFDKIDKNYYPVDICIELEKVECLELLLDAGANPEKGNKHV